MPPSWALGNGRERQRSVTKADDSQLVKPLDQVNQHNRSCNPIKRSPF